MVPNDDTRSRLLSAAGETFAERGFDSATVREICQRAQANIAAVNYHFGDKERLYIEAVRESHCVRSQMYPLPDWPADMGIDDRLAAFIAMFLHRLMDEARPDWHLGLMLRELAHPTQACAEIVRDYIRPMADVLRDILAERMPADMVESERWLYGFSIVGQCLFYYVHKPIVRELVGEENYRTYSIERLAKHIARFSLAGLQIVAEDQAESLR